MNSWRSRILIGLIFWLTSEFHALTMTDVPSFEHVLEGADGLIFFGSASAVDWLLLYSAPFLISGRLCDDIQASCIASIVINCVGFCAYMAEHPPTVYNTLITGLAYVQYLRLLFVGRYDADHHERAMVPGALSVRTSANH